MGEDNFFWIMTTVEVSLTFIAIFVLFRTMRRYLGPVNLGFDKEHDDQEK
jgi:hypothetical protein